MNKKSLAVLAITGLASATMLAQAKAMKTDFMRAYEEDEEADLNKIVKIFDSN